MRKQKNDNQFDYEDHESGVRFDRRVPDGDKIRVRFWLIFQGKFSTKINNKFGFLVKN